MNDDEAMPFAVKHFVACGRVQVVRAFRGNPYTLHDVRYEFAVPEDREWPIRLDELWLFARFYTSVGGRRLTLAVYWEDTRTDSAVAFFDLVVQFPAGDPVHNVVWNVSAVRYPGPGRYRFALIDDPTGEQVAEEWIRITRVS